jgi:hypothetical protein
VISGLRLDVNYICSLLLKVIVAISSSNLNIKIDYLHLLTRPEEIIIIIIFIIISFMQGIYTYIPETNNVPREYIVAAILLLLFMVPISPVPALALLCFYVSPFRSMCAVPNMVVFCSYLTSWLLLLLLLLFLCYKWPVRLYHIMLQVACPPLPYYVTSGLSASSIFSTLSHKPHDFRKKKLLNTKCVL